MLPVGSPRLNLIQLASAGDEHPAQELWNFPSYLRNKYGIDIGLQINRARPTTGTRSLQEAITDIDYVVSNGGNEKILLVLPVYFNDVRAPWAGLNIGERALKLIQYANLQAHVKSSLLIMRQDGSCAWFAPEYMSAFDYYDCSQVLSCGSNYKTYVQMSNFANFKECADYFQSRRHSEAQDKFTAADAKLLDTLGVKENEYDLLMAYHMLTSP